MRNAKHIAFGCLALATIPVVAWLSFGYHVAVGIFVTMIYGSAASLVGTMSLGRGVLAIATQRRERARDKQLSALPRARLLGGGKH